LEKYIIFKLLVKYIILSYKYIYIKLYEKTMKAFVPLKESKQSTQQAQVFLSLTPFDAELLILKAISSERLEVSEQEVKQLVKQLIRASEALQKSNLNFVRSPLSKANILNKRNNSNRTFIKSLVTESGKRVSQSA
jgi:hypothetical protein